MVERDENTGRRRPSLFERLTGRRADTTAATGTGGTPAFPASLTPEASGTPAASEAKGHTLDENDDTRTTHDEQEAPVARRSRRASTPASAPAVAQPDDASVDASASASAPADAAGEQPADEQPAAPAARAPRKRAPRKAAVAPAAPAAPDAPLAGVPDADATADEPAAAEPVDASAPVVAPAAPVRAVPSLSVFFQAPDIAPLPPRRERDDRRDDSRDEDDDLDRDERPSRPSRSSRRGGRGQDRSQDRGISRDGRGRDTHDDDHDDEDDSPSVRRRARRRSGEEGRDGDDAPGTVVKVRTPREPELITEPQRIKGSTRLEAKKQRRRDGRDAGRRRPVLTESEYLARRESVDRSMIVRSRDGKIQIGVLEDQVLVEHYVARADEASLIGNVYLGRVQNVLPSMEAAFIDIGRGRNAVLYSGEVDWEAANADKGGGSHARRIEVALKPGDRVLVQVTKDPVGHKGARLTSQVSLPGRYLVYVPNGSMNGISRKLPDTERARLKKTLKEVLPENVGVIVRTAAEGATEEQLKLDVERLTSQWAEISRQVEKAQAPALLHSEPDLLLKIIRDVFNEDFRELVIDGGDAQEIIEGYLRGVAPDLIDRVQTYSGEKDSFDHHRVSEQIEKALDRKVWLPSGGSLVIDRTEAMTVVDVNTGKFVGSGGNLEETVTKNNLEAAEEIVRQMRLRDIGGIIVVDFIDMVLETNRDLVLRRLVECLSRDRTKHQVAEVTSLGLVQMTRKKLGLGLLESFSENCETCAGRGIIIHHDPLMAHKQTPQEPVQGQGRRRGGKGQQEHGNGSGGNGGSRGNGGGQAQQQQRTPAASTHSITDDARSALAKIATSTIQTVNEAIDRVEDVVRTPDESTDAAVQPESAPLEEQTRGDRPRRSRGGRGRASSATVEAQDRSEPQAPAAEAASAPVEDPTPADAPVEEPALSTLEPREAIRLEPVQILDIPVASARTAPRRVSSADAEQLLGSVLDALPQPKEPGQGRSRSRRVSTQTLTTPAPADDAS
ncbi:Rne/Rng family ribonuclease [Clavibacter michiganensis]|uniref:Rne/Rng family ribonuclease n=1 Tax=Clavibacter michiganensis TaxID=28447 RepID=UPI0026DC3E99|nr:Rne/Rng family ribonuclease [Clavibacter michiganensis]MDO4024814.1 Rne/Rng family ribonuclease [Clavibacter michiganensis]MDO4034650.1 Rne/Rng family ribonuclease [Clavibacter michiganensis]MDO4046483.1 Rne/Rng family ribonuclease [Clavibacter michiganensis]MDO4104728.1 Rne/Rng family ribonuclease [Clavibacter michiganensis]MDO4133217.1 Rne/Rng family ribonuclease [Clavibacter michiganensis]